MWVAYFLKAYQFSKCKAWLFTSESLFLRSSLLPSFDLSLFSSLDSPPPLVIFATYSSLSTYKVISFIRNTKTFNIFPLFYHVYKCSKKQKHMRQGGDLGTFEPSEFLQSMCVLNQNTSNTANYSPSNSSFPFSTYPFVYSSS